MNGSRHNFASLEKSKLTGKVEFVHLLTHSIFVNIQANNKKQIYLVKVPFTVAVELYSEVCSLHAMDFLKMKYLL
jgi:hypothetical protein